MSNANHIPAGYEAKFKFVDYFEEGQDFYDSEDDDLDSIVYPQLANKRQVVEKDKSNSVDEKTTNGSDTDPSSVEIAPQEYQEKVEKMNFESEPYSETPADVVHDDEFTQEDEVMEEKERNFDNENVEKDRQDVDQQSSVEKDVPPKWDYETDWGEAEKKNPEYMTEMEHFLYTAELMSLYRLFSDNSITLRDLVRFSEEDFQRLKLSFGDQIRLIDGIKKFHKKEWQPSEAPLLSHKAEIQALDAIRIIKRITKQIAFLEIKVDYLRDRLKIDPDMVTRGDELVSVKNMIDENIKAINSCKSLLENLNCFNMELHLYPKNTSKKALSTSSHNSFTKAFSKLAIPSLVVLSLTIVGGILLQSKEFP